MPTGRTISKDQLERILQGAPQGVRPDQVIAGLRSKGYEIEGLSFDAAASGGTGGMPPAPEAAAPAKKKGVMSGISDFLFNRTGKFLGTAVGQAGELAAIATDPVSRERALNADTAEFQRIFPFLGRNVDKKASTVAKKTAGEALGAAGELSVLASGVPGAGASNKGVPLISKQFVKNAAPRIIRGGAFGAAGGVASGLEEDLSAGDVAKRGVAGAVVGVAFSSAAELLAKAGDVAAKKFMDSALNPYKKDVGKVERLVDDKTLSERLNEKGIKGTNKGIVRKLKTLENETARKLDDVFKGSDMTVPGWNAVEGLDDLKNSPYVPQDVRSAAELDEIIMNRKKLYVDKVFTPLEALREKRGLGRRVGAKAFAADSETLRRMTNEKLVDRAIYDGFKRELENIADDPGLVRSLNKDLSTYIDGINLFEKAQTRGVKLLNVLSAMGGAGLGAMLTGTATGAGMTAAGVGLGFAGLRTTLAKTLMAQIANQGPKLTQEAAQKVIDRIIFEMQNPTARKEE